MSTLVQVEGVQIRLQPQRPELIAAVVADELVNELARHKVIKQVWQVEHEADEQMLYTPHAQKYYNRYYNLILGLLKP